MPWLKKEVPRRGERIAQSARPCVFTKFHRIGFAVRKIENHDGQSGCGALPILQSAIDMYIAESIAAYKDRICFVDVPCQLRLACRQ